MLNPWKTLGVHRASTPAEVRSAYLAVVRKVHPDMKKGNHDKCADANEAFRILKDKKLTNSHVALLLMTHTLCQLCRGSGVKYITKGITNRLAAPCKSCGGSGMVVKPKRSS